MSKLQIEIAIDFEVDDMEEIKDLIYKIMNEGYLVTSASIDGKAFMNTMNTLPRNIPEMWDTFEALFKKIDGKRFVDMRGEKNADET